MFEFLYACASTRKSDEYLSLETTSDEDTVSKTKKEDIENQEDMMTEALFFFKKVMLPTKISEQGIFNEEMLKKIFERNNTSAPGSK